MLDVVKCTAEFKSYSSGLKKIHIEGSSMSVVSAMRAIVEREGTGSPIEARQTVHLSDSGPASISVYSAVAPLHHASAKQRSVSRKEAERFGIAALRELGFLVDGEEEEELPDGD